MLHIFPMWCVNRHYLVTTDCRNMQSVVLPADEQHSDVDEGNGKKKKKCLVTIAMGAVLLRADVDVSFCPR